MFCLLCTRLIPSKNRIQNSVPALWMLLLEEADHFVFSLFSCLSVFTFLSDRCLLWPLLVEMVCCLKEEKRQLIAIKSFII